jgi:hypothetical protein
MGLASFLGIGDSGAGDLYRQAGDEYRNIKLPDLSEIDFEDLINSGNFSPEDLASISQEDSNFNQISTDPRLRAAQEGALSSLQDVANQGGLNFSDKARLAQIQGDSSAQERGGREAILQNARQRGISGSGIELASNLINQQESAGRRNMEGLNVAAGAEQRALEAMLQSGNLAGSIRGQDYGEQSQKAAAQDAINRFNTTNQQNVLAVNNQQRNQAGLYNQQNAQRISDSNVGQNNQARLYNAQIPQQQFNNQMGRAGGVANSLGGQAGAADNAQQRRAGFTGSLIGAGGTIAGGAIGGAAAKAGADPALRASHQSNGIGQNPDEDYYGQYGARRF